MKIRQTGIEGLVIIEPAFFGDSRGFFMETYNADRFREFGLPTDFRQDNHSRSGKNVLRGLHFQTGDSAQGKFVRVSRGAVFDVAVDLRAGSKTFGKHFSVELSEENRLSFYIPVGFAHGFCTLTDVCDFQYKCTNTYNAKAEGGIIWNDPDIGIKWPVENPIISEKDVKLPRLRDMRDTLTF